MSTVIGTVSSELHDKFVAANTTSIEEQKKLFVLRFVFMLELEGVKFVEDISKVFKAEAGEDKELDNGPEFSKFLNHTEKQFNRPFTGKAYRDLVFTELDLDNNGKVSFLEYLLFSYKSQIVKEHYKRQGSDVPKGLKFDKGVLGCILIGELFDTPVGVDEKLDALTVEMITRKKERDARMSELETQIAQVSNVKAMGLRKELETLKKEEKDNVNDMTVSAAGRRVAKKQEKEVAELYQNIGA